MIVRIAVSLLLAAFVAHAHAQEPDNLPPAPASISANEYAADLMQLYRESRLEDPRVLAAYAHAQAGVDRQREAFGGLLPQVTASGSFNRTNRDVETYSESYNNESYALRLSQHLYNKAAWENYQKFKQLARQGEFESVDAQAEATVDLAQRYFVALASDDELELILAERRATQKNLDRVNALYDRKMAMVTDVLDLQARVDALAAQEVEARNQVRLSREELSEIVGRPVEEKLSRIREDVELQVPGEAIDQWIDRALAANPALKAREQALGAADAAVRESRGAHYPSLSMNLSAQRSDVGYDNTLAPRSDSYVASFGVQIPIYSGGSASARVRSLHSDRLATEQQLEAIRRQVVKETTSAYLTAQSSIERIRASRNALESAEKSSVAAERGFQYGVVNAVDVLTSVQNEYKARRDLLKAQYDFITNLLVLNRWAGRLSEQSIENVNVWLARSEQARALERKTTE
ncbi:TolC family outer membrane protein [Stutzerimonas stutzeri]|uniref:TolC family outer membrane protein n=1 Tax=Stutzerimonas stutzeri TaxID=316 RepID=UPI002159AF16|nr:TolC family outer membrane protein [Stutzerimonas stutzeri]